MGLGHTNDIGDEEDEMGDYLSATNWGTGFEVDQLTCGVLVRALSLCAL